MSWFLRCPAWRLQINNICSTVSTQASCSGFVWAQLTVTRQYGTELLYENCSGTSKDRHGRVKKKKKQKADSCSSSQSMLHWLAPTAYRSMSLIKAFFFLSVLTFIQWSRFLWCTPWRVVKSGKTQTSLWSQQSWRGAPQRTPLLIHFERTGIFGHELKTAVFSFTFAFNIIWSHVGRVPLCAALSHPCV